MTLVPRSEEARKMKSRTNAAGRELMAAVAEVHAAVMSGDPFAGMTVRQVEIPDPPAFKPSDVRALREKLRVSVTLRTPNGRFRQAG